MLYLLIVLLTFTICITLNKLFNIFRLCKRNYKDKLVPYSGGTIIFISLFISFNLFCFWGKISFIKNLFFLSVLTLIYIIGILDDTLSNNDVKGLEKNINALVLKRISTGIIKSVLIIVIACYIYYFFNEEYWILKGILTALTTNLFNLFDLRPGRSIKFYYVFFFFLSFSYIRWTKELFIIFSIVITIYYFWNAYGLSMLGGGGANLIGFISGLILCEAIGTSSFGLIAFIGMFITLQLVLNKYSLTEFK